jgi:polysaccharide chain length determinant protein (PEP-CTERM system associated)
LAASNNGSVRRPAAATVVGKRLAVPRSREQNDRGFDFVLDIWQRRKWLAILVFVAAFAGAASLTMSLPNLYRASTTVLVERQQVSEAFVRTSITAELETRIQTIDKQVRSRASLAEIITRLNLYPDLRGHAPIDAIVDRMRHDIDFALNGVDQTTGRTAMIAFTVTYSGLDPVTAADVANTLAAAYVQEHTKSRERQAVRTAEFLRSQLNEIKQTLDSQQQRAGQFKQQHSGELPEQVEVNLSALDRLNNRLRLNGEYQIRAIERRDRIEQQLAIAAAPAPARESEPDGPGAELARLKGQLTDLRRKFSDQYPDVIRLQQEISVLEHSGLSGTSGTSDTGNPATTEPPVSHLASQQLAEVDNQLASLKAEENLLRQVIDGYETRVENAPQRQQELQQLSRDSEATKEQYQTLLKRYEEAQLSENLEQGQNVEHFRVLDPAIPSRRPAAPNRLWLLGLGLCGSLGLALAAVVAAEKLDTTFHTVEDLRAFAGLQALAVIRRIPTPSELRHRRMRYALVTVSAIVALVLIVFGARYVGLGNEQIVLMTVRGKS